MSDDRTLEMLDQRGRAAAAGVRTAVVERPIPAFDPDLVRIDIDVRPDGARPRRPRPVVGLLAVAAAVLVVVAAVVALVGTGDDDSAPPADRVAPSDLRPYALASAPEGFAIAAVTQGSDAEVDDATGLEGPATVYGPAPDQASLAVGVVPPDEVSLCDSPEASDDCEQDPVDAVVGDLPPVVLEGGRRAWDATEAVGGDALMVEVDDRVVLVLGPALSGDAIQEAAEDVTADGTVATVPADSLPDGWSALGEVPLINALGGVAQGRVALPGDAGWTVSYGPEVDDGEQFEMVAVAVQAGGRLQVGLPGLVADQVEDVEVRGHAGRLSRVDPVADATVRLWAVRWEERPGEVVEVAVMSAADRFGRADVLALAEGLVALGPGEVEALRAEARAQLPEPEPGAAVVGEGRFSDGAAWTLVAGPEGEGGSSQVSLETGAASSSSGSVGVVTAAGAAGPDGAGAPPDGVFPGGVTVATGEGYGWVVGATHDDVDSVEVRDAGGATVTTVTPLTAEGVSGFVAEVPAAVAEAATTGEGGVSLVVVALDAGGVELGRLEV